MVGRKNMRPKKTIGVLWALAACCCALVDAQTVTVSASKLYDGGSLANGTIYWTPVLANGVKAVYHRADGGMVSVTPAQATVTSGAFSLTIPDTALTTPTNLCFHLQLVTQSGNVMDIPCVQPTANNSWCISSACNFDNYTPSTSPQPPAAYVFSINGVGGAFTLTGCTQSGTSITCNGGGGGSVGDSDVLGQTASQSTVNVVGTVPGAGKYRISYYADQNALCASGSVTVLFTFSWIDGTRSRSVQSIPLTLGSSALSSASIQGVIPIFAAASSAVTYTSTVAGSCATGGPASYDAHVTVEALQ
jgi:hypothetical protein